LTEFIQTLISFNETLQCNTKIHK